ncbi:MAG TPA: hypothetical protein VF741_00555, partial [Candidatus Aquilonibacter sp.]
MDAVVTIGLTLHRLATDLNVFCNLGVIRAGMFPANLVVRMALWSAVLVAFGYGSHDRSSLWPR